MGSSVPFVYVNSRITRRADCFRNATTVSTSTASICGSTRTPHAHCVEPAPRPTLRPILSWSRWGKPRWRAHPKQIKRCPLFQRAARRFPGNPTPTLTSATRARTTRFSRLRLIPGQPKRRFLPCRTRPSSSKGQHLLLVKPSTKPSSTYRDKSTLFLLPGYSLALISRCFRRVIAQIPRYSSPFTE